MQDPRIYTEEEIDLFLHGDRREIDRLLLSSTNAVTAAFIAFRDEEFRPHAEAEMEMAKALGQPADVLRRRLWLDQQIDKDRDRAALRKKILDASLFWVLPILLMAFFTTVETGIKAKITEWLKAPVDTSQKKDAK